MLTWTHSVLWSFIADYKQAWDGAEPRIYPPNDPSSHYMSLAPEHNTVLGPGLISGLEYSLVQPSGIVS